MAGQSESPQLSRARVRVPARRDIHTPSYLKSPLHSLSRSESAEGRLKYFFLRVSRHGPASEPRAKWPPVYPAIEGDNTAATVPARRYYIRTRLIIVSLKSRHLNIITPSSFRYSVCVFDKSRASHRVPLGRLSRVCNGIGITKVKNGIAAEVNPRGKERMERLSATSGG